MKVSVTVTQDVNLDFMYELLEEKGIDISNRKELLSKIRKVAKHVIKMTIDDFTSAGCIEEKIIDVFDIVSD